MKTWKELADSFALQIKQSTPNVNLTEKVMMNYLADAQRMLQARTGYCVRTEAINIPANNPITSPVALSFRVQHPMTVWDLGNQIEYGIRSWEEFQQYAYVNTNLLNQPNIIPPAVPPMTTDYSSYIVSFDNRLMYVYPIPLESIVLTVHYKPALPSLASLDPYWAGWYASDAAFNTNYTTKTPEREFYDYEEAFIDYAIWKYCDNIDARWAQNAAGKAQARFEETIRIMLNHKQNTSKMVQVQPYGGGVEVQAVGTMGVIVTPSTW